MTFAVVFLSDKQHVIISESKPRRAINIYLTFLPASFFVYTLTLYWRNILSCLCFDAQGPPHRNVGPMTKVEQFKILVPIHGTGSFIVRDYSMVGIGRMTARQA